MYTMAQNVELSEFWKSKSSNTNNFFICNVCRLCANVSDNVVPIFDKINEKGSIYDKMKKCLPSILVRESDIKPKQVCVSCVSKLDLCVSFIEMSLDADFKFDSILQTRVVPQVQISNERVSQPINSSVKVHDCYDFSSSELICLRHARITSSILSSLADLSWLQIKSEPMWKDLKPDVLPNRQTEQKFTEQLMSNVSIQMNHQKSYQPPHSLSLNQLKVENENYGVFVNKSDTNHNFVQNYIMPESMSGQDLIVLVEVKNKDNTSTNNLILTNKKNDLTTGCVPDSCNKIVSSNDIVSSLPTKLIDSAVNSLDIGSLTDFDETACLLKAFENDLLSALKTESMNSNDVPSFDYMPSKVPEKNDKDLLSRNTTNLSCNTSTIMSADSVKKSPPIRDFCCSICGRCFTRRNRLNAHIARHSSERPHSCDKCDQRFITRWDLTLHLRIHSGVFSCEYCGKAFPAKGKLERHRRTHTGERPFPCTQCSKAFSEKRNLENHLKTHAAANARKTTIQAPSVYLSCGHINNITSYGQRKCCDICQKFSDTNPLVPTNSSNGVTGSNSSSGAAATIIGGCSASAATAITTASLAPSTLCRRNVMTGITSASSMKTEMKCSAVSNINDKRNHINLS